MGDAELTEPDEVSKLRTAGRWIYRMGIPAAVIFAAIGTYLVTERDEIIGRFQNDGPKVPVVDIPIPVGVFIVGIGIALLVVAIGMAGRSILELFLFKHFVPLEKHTTAMADLAAQKDAEREAEKNKYEEKLATQEQFTRCKLIVQRFESVYEHEHAGVNEVGKALVKAAGSLKSDDGKPKIGEADLIWQDSDWTNLKSMYARVKARVKACEAGPNQERLFDAEAEIRNMTNEAHAHVCKLFTLIRRHPEILETVDSKDSPSFSTWLGKRNELAQAVKDMLSLTNDLRIGARAGDNLTIDGIKKGLF